LENGAFSAAVSSASTDIDMAGKAIVEDFAVARGAKKSKNARRN
jgi:hypothetical protein